MECIYLPEYNEKIVNYKVPNDEAKHLKALHTRNNDKILVTNGKGTIWECLVTSHSKYDYFLNSLDVSHFEKNQIIDIAVGVLKNKDRFEFAIEKSVELGSNRIIPLLAEHCETNKLNDIRLESKIISAMKQSKNPFKTELYGLTKITDVDYSYYNTIILTDENGTGINETNLISPILILIGPEGGFSKNEFEFINQQTKLNKLFLSNNRLRTETAVITSLSLVSNLIELK